MSAFFLLGAGAALLLFAALVFWLLVELGIPAIRGLLGWFTSRNRPGGTTGDPSADRRDRTS